MMKVSSLSQRELINELNILLESNEKLTVPRVLPLVSAFYKIPGNEAGGTLGSVIEKGNIKDKHIRSSIEYAQEQDDITGVLLGRLMLKLSKTQRLKLYPDTNSYCHIPD